MEDALTYRLMNPADVNDVSELVTRIFNEFVAPDYSLEGIQEFQKYAQPTAFMARSRTNHFTLMSVVRNKVVGIIEVRNYNHISLLFVATEYQRRGIARELWSKALQICYANKTDLSEISVNSSSFAVPIYERLGFRPIGNKQVRNGIAFIPMVLKLPTQ